jgi:hypothetical protein
MDDGRLDYREKSHYAYSVSTDAFTIGEVRLLQSLLLERFAIKSSIHLSLCRGKRYPKIYIGADGREKFLTTIMQYVLDCFRYKLPPQRYILTLQRLHAKPQHHF